MQKLTYPIVIFIACVASVVNAMPLYFMDPGGDIMIHYALLDCFASKLWQGEIYPRWCIDANGGLGTPMPLFYFPFSYYMAALFYPLHLFGISVDTVYLCSVTLAGIIACVTCWRWLSDIVGKHCALLGAILYVWMPYRCELLLFRSAYAELWLMAFIPLLLMYLRRFSTDPQRNFWPLCLLTALCTLTHVPGTIIALSAGGIYLLFTAGQSWKPYVAFILAVFLGFMMVSFYLIPAHALISALAPDAVESKQNVWVNRFVTWEDWKSRPRVMVAASVMVLVTLGLGISAWRGRMRIGQKLVRREIAAWTVIGLSVFFLAFKISAPVWALIHLVGPVATPWRVQMLLMFAALYFFAVRAQWLMTPKQIKTWRWDYGVTLGFMMMLSCFITVTRISGYEQTDEVARTMQILFASEYRTQWTDSEHATPDYMRTHYLEHKSRNILVAKGKGDIDAPQWGRKDVKFKAHMDSDGVVRIAHYYFPIWHAAIDGKDAPLEPEEKTGFMRMAVPKGTHDIRLYYDIAQTIPRLYWLSLALSIAAALFCMVGLHRSRTPSQN